MVEVYRGHSIQLTRTQAWEAVITEVATGIVLPTKATARLQEGHAVAARRACKLIDLYVGQRNEQSDAA
jgi:hypothetical protein